MPKALLLPTLLFALLSANAAVLPADAGPELAQRMHRAEDASALDVDGLKPWHLKLAVSLFDDKGKPQEQGTMEEWWASAKAHKIVYQLPSYSATVLTNEQGTFGTADAGTPPMLLDVLLDQVVHPLRTGRDVDQSTPELRKQAFGKVQMDCIMLSQPIKQVTYAPLGLFPTYCFNAGQDQLRISYNYGSQLVLRNALGTFQGRNVSLDTAVQTNGVRVATGHVDALSTGPQAEMDFAKTDGLVADDSAPVQVSAALIAGRSISKAIPIYPASAKNRHVSGVVVLHALIGRDGHIRSLRLVSLPDPDLGIAALSAVRQWVYKPYLLNGKPVEVETTISVTFGLG